MYDRVLIPTDGSEGMESDVLPHAADLADRYAADIHLLYTVDVRTYMTLPDDSQQSVRETVREEGDDALQSAITALSEPDVTAVIDEGIPHRVIAEYVVENDIDLIVMGTHGRTGPERQALGSVAERTTQVAPVPVHIVPIEGDDSDDGDAIGFQ